MLAYILLFASVLIDTLKNIFLNHFGRDYTERARDAYLFNVVGSIGALIFLLCSGAEFSISAYSMVLAIVFAFASAMTQFFLLMAMSTGSMSYSVMISYLGLIVPTIYSIAIGAQSVKAYQLLGLALMILTLYLGVGAKGKVKVTLKWLLYAIGSFAALGVVGLVQFLHQNSIYKDEIGGFLIWSFIMMTVIFYILYLFSKIGAKEPPKYVNQSKATCMALGTGVIIGATNKVNLWLSGVLPSIVFFPIINGGVIILSSIASVLLFKEKLSKSQALGIFTGILSVCLLGI